MSNIITGSASSTLSPITIAPVTAADAHLGIAQQFLFGARALASASGCALTFTFVCGHIVECLFKAFLSWKGVPESTLKGRNVRHNLSALRAMCVAQGLTVDPIEPQWLTMLDSLHDSPFQLRYPVGLNGFVTPNPHHVLADLELLEQLVRSGRP